jgi:hypothetical protein
VLPVVLEKKILRYHPLCFRGALCCFYTMEFCFAELDSFCSLWFGFNVIRPAVHNYVRNKLLSVMNIICRGP